MKNGLSQLVEHLNQESHECIIQIKLIIDLIMKILFSSKLPLWKCDSNHNHVWVESWHEGVNLDFLREMWCESQDPLIQIK